jgi:CubicO group peptidase (beta-lactamase class C family)
VKQFNTRLSPPGVRFSYSSAESLVLGLVLAAATKRLVPGGGLSFDNAVKMRLDGPET